MVDQVTPILGVDEFKSQIGDDSDIITINFIVSGKEVGNDLVDWLERGYDWIIDAEISPGEVLDKKYYVFADMNRRSTAPRRIMEILEDLYTLTGIKAEKWQLKLDGKKVFASREVLETKLILSPSEYRERRDGELNEWRDIAGISRSSTLLNAGPELESWKKIAGIK